MRIASLESEAERPLVTFEGYKMADLAGPDRPKCGGSGAHISTICNVSELGGTTQVRKFALKGMN